MAHARAPLYHFLLVLISAGCGGNNPGGRDAAPAADLAHAVKAPMDAAPDLEPPADLAPTPDAAAVLTALSIVPSAATVARSTSDKLTASGTFSDGTVKDVTSRVSWQSSDASKATVAGGAVSGLVLGGVTITATDPTTGILATANVTVTSAALVSVAITPGTPGIAKGRSQQFVATGSFSDGSAQDLSASLTWSSSNLMVATVASGGLSATANAGSGTTGTTNIIATDPATQIFGSATLTVGAPALVSIAVTPGGQSIAKGRTLPFAATGTFSDGSTRDLSSAVAWSSSSTGVATIDVASGLATSPGVGTGTTGTTMISATDPATQIAGSTGLTVIGAALVSIAVTPGTPSIAKGLTQQFIATGTYSDGSTHVITASVGWSSSSSAVATIAPTSGLGTSHNAGSGTTGTTTITATDATTQIAGTTTLTVLSPVLATIAVTPGDPFVAKGLAQFFAATGTLTDTSTVDLTGSATWSASPSSIAFVGYNGSPSYVYAENLGSTTIYALDVPSGITGSTLFTVNSPGVTSLSIRPTPLHMAIPWNGISDKRLFVTASYTDGSSRDVSSSVSWTSNDSSIVTVDSRFGVPLPAGSVYSPANSPGNTTLVAHYGGATAQVTAFVESVTNVGGSAQGYALDLTPLVSTLAGAPGVSGRTDGSWTNARFNLPAGITIAAADFNGGNTLYVTDGFNCTIRAIDDSGVRTIAGVPGSCISVDDNNGANASFAYPSGITTDGNGTIYVVDSNTCVIRAVSLLSTHSVATIAGTAGSCVDADASSATKATFESPIGITYANNALYVVEDSGEKIREINLGVLNSPVTTIAGSGSVGSSDAPPRFNFPEGIASDGTHLFIADTNNHTIRQILLSNGTTTTLAGSAGFPGFSDGFGQLARFSSPTNLTTDGVNLYIADSGNSAIRQLNLDTGVVTTLAGASGVAGFADGSGSAAKFDGPQGITTDGNNLYVVDWGNNVIRLIQ